MAKRYGHDDIAKILVIKGGAINCMHDDYLWDPSQPQWAGPNPEMRPLNFPEVSPSLLEEFSRDTLHMDHP